MMAIQLTELEHPDVVIIQACTRPLSEGGYIIVEWGGGGGGGGSDL